MSQDLAVVPPPQSVTPLAPELVRSVMLSGNLAPLNPDQRAAFYRFRCEALGLDPATQPFEYLTLNGKVVLYAKKECSNQLSSNRRLSTEVRNTKIEEGNYEVWARCIGPDGRFTDDIGAVSIKGLTGESLCNAKMKAATKAKRRAILGHVGLGMLDESEVESIKGGWSDSGSREAAQAVARQKLAQAGAHPGEGPAPGEGGGGCPPPQYPDRGTSPEAHDRMGDHPALVDDEIPVKGQTQAHKPATRKAGPSGGLTSAQIRFQEELKPIKDQYLLLGTEDGYRAIVRRFGVEKSKELLVPEDQQKLIRALQVATLELEMRACGANMYTNAQFLALFSTEEHAIRTANFIYATCKRNKDGYELGDAVVAEQIAKGWDAKMLTSWWTARNQEIAGKKGQ